MSVNFVPVHPPSGLTSSVPRRRRLLMVTGIFPPISIVGVVRSLKFCKYLREHDWDVEVLAYRPRPGCEDLDERILAEIPRDVIVHRTPWIDPTQSLKLIRRILGRSPTGTTTAAQPSNGSGNVNGGRLGRLLRGLPDNIAPWIPFGVLGGLCAALRSDCIYSSAPPFTAHIVAAWLKRLSGRPWISDFRDPWIGNEALDPVNSFHARWHHNWEAHVIRRSEYAINVTAELRDRLAARYPDQPADKFAMIFRPTGIVSNAPRRLNRSRSVTSARCITADRRFRFSRPFDPCSRPAPSPSET